MTEDLARRNRQLGSWLAALVAFGVGLSFAFVPLYDLFCRVTGYGGTPQIAKAGAERILDRRITIRFDANTAPDLPWSFQPGERAVTLRVGETGLTAYRAVNRAGETVVGTATFNVTPAKAGAYFNKIECFCFERQPLAPGQSAEFPVMFFVDPSIADDPGMADVSQITLSYTFFRAADQEIQTGMLPAAAGGGSAVTAR